MKSLLLVSIISLTSCGTLDYKSPNKELNICEDYCSTRGGLRDVEFGRTVYWCQCMDFTVIRGNRDPGSQWWVPTFKRIDNYDDKNEGSTM